ncbi:MAG: PP2C family protein-serine/threonine phosphatase [Roseofilum sp. SBFL]|uniref:PP2C family protein-serine/threonine phosphatase n=1 Tax=unclassified Roseofilum TaxID=2620099 RepID=UPI001B1EB55E|nr:MULTISPECIES: PP2C family protein-serine/threonine phosphatase [unclassified Roseofilum]MBP0015437.1 PP2C family protein-serine/threonine phosphatase [Roseofilum sp. SID3]MBP0023848.1 PP2C family protein-serine/threonine phosphatase [Roseofilum sp. SID2]MBP0039707.1 PP2C family protein-serine/threonine phosphatase [Roseofilum sp. SID1]MBP0044939.1 PP2C family protein-serine/threonine phosphatase [Roseofilum sp. SBFL]
MSAVPIPQPSPQPTGNSTPQLPTSTPKPVSEDQTPVHALKELVVRLRREQNKIQDLLMSLGFALRSFNNLNQFLELIPLMAARVTDADGGALVLFQANGKLKLEQMHCHDSHQCQDIRQALETVNTQLRGRYGRSLNMEEMTVLLDREVNHYLGSHTQLFGTAVIVRKTERGRLYVFSRNSDYTWTETREKLLRLIADQTAVAIENDELSAELRKKERLDRELEIGAEIQNQLLPHTYPQIEGLKLAARCQNANRVGGDYYDFISIHPPEWLKRSGTQAQPSRRWCITVGDVMGKGVPAGLIMTMLRGMLRAEVLNGHSPSRILQHLNHAMYQDLDQANRFVTLFYSEYDPSTQVLSYSNAAHNPPLLWQASNQLIQRLDTMGMLIGLDLNSEYEDAQSQLYPGDIILYYTDGFTDASNRKGDRFDEENLIEAFQLACQHYANPQAILDYLFDRVNEFMGPGNDHRDDMTLVVMQVDPHRQSAVH